MNTVFSRIVGENIRLARRRKKMTQEVFAKTLGINRSTLAKYEKSLLPVNLVMLEKIANGLEVSMISLMSPKAGNKKAHPEASKAAG